MGEHHLGMKQFNQIWVWVKIVIIYVIRKKVLLLTEDGIFKKNSFYDEVTTFTLDVNWR